MTRSVAARRRFAPFPAAQTIKTATPLVGRADVEAAPERPLNGDALQRRDFDQFGVADRGERRVPI
jgi:hypothetical protein